MIRADGRAPGALRDIRIIPSFMKNAHGSVLIEWGRYACIMHGHVYGGDAALS